MRFKVTTEGENKPGLAELCERHANELWIPDHLTAKQKAGFVLDHFKWSIAAKLERLEVTLARS